MPMGGGQGSNWTGLPMFPASQPNPACPVPCPPLHAGPRAACRVCGALTVRAPRCFG
jgi:hypothetical protein